MPINPYCSICLIALISSAIASAEAEVDEVNEPKQAAHLEIDGQVLPISYDKSTAIEIDGKTVPISLKQSDLRELNLQHLSFRYPAYFAFDVSLKDDTKIPVRWDLEGHDIDVTVFRASADELRYEDDNHPLDSWIFEAFGEKNFIRGNSVSIDIRQLTLEGTRYTVPIKGRDFVADLLLDVYEVPGRFGRVRYFLVLFGWDGENAEEESLMRKLLAESFTIRDEPLSPEWRVDYDDADSED